MVGPQSKGRSAKALTPFFTPKLEKQDWQRGCSFRFSPQHLFCFFLRFSEFLFIQDWKNEVKDNHDGLIRIPRHCILVNFWTETRENGFGFDSWFQSHQGEKGRVKQPSSQQQCGTGAVHRSRKQRARTRGQAKTLKDRAPTNLLL